jgi:hypothetical protein
MKKSIKIILVAVFMSGVITQCKKSDNTSGGQNNATLTLSSSTVKKGEPLLVNASTLANSPLVRWTITPGNTSLVSAANSSSTILFSQAGGYTVTANYYTDSSSGISYDSVSSPVQVTDSVYIPPAPDTNNDTISLAGDQLMVTPAAMSDSGFILEFLSANLYNCIPYFLGYSYGFNNSTFTASFDYVGFYTVNNCGGVKNHAGVYIFYGAVGDGDYQIDIELNHVHYYGSVNVSGSTYTFTWPYDSGVTLSPLVIHKS